MNHLAVVLMLPDEIEKILDSLRGAYAPHMKYINIPHITLANLFAPRVDKGLVAEKLKQVADRTRPFRLGLNGIRYFEERSNVAYIAIADPKPVIDLHYAVSRAVSDIASDAYGLKFSFVNFVPHVTIGDAIPADIFPKVKQSISKATPGYEFRMTEFCLIAEEDVEIWGVAERFTLAG